MDREVCHLHGAILGDRCEECVDAHVAELESELSRLRGAAVPFRLSEYEALVMDATYMDRDINAVKDALSRAIDDLEFAQQQHAATCLRASEADMRVCQLEREVASWKSSAIGMEISLEGRNASLAEADKALATALGLLRDARRTIFKICMIPQIRDYVTGAQEWLDQTDALLAAHKEVQG